MRRLWAPWRLAYVQEAGAAQGCVFCQEAAGELGDSSLVVHRGEQVVVHAQHGRKLPLVSEVVSLLAGQGIPFRDLRSEQPNLEDVFLSLTGREMRE